MRKIQQIFWLAFGYFFLAVSPATAATNPCQQGNILTSFTPTLVGWNQSERLSDNIVGSLGDTSRSQLTSQADEVGAIVAWMFDLRPLYGVLVEMEADDVAMLQVRSEAGAWMSITTMGPSSGSGLEIYAGQTPDRQATGLRLVAISGAPLRLAEVAAYSCKESWPPKDLITHVSRPELPFWKSWSALGFGRAVVGGLSILCLAFAVSGRVRLVAVAAGSVVTAAMASSVAWPVALVAGVLTAFCVWFVPFIGPFTLVVANLYGWTNFGDFRLSGSGAVHVHELFHYGLGSKYASELGYDSLYLCAVAAEEELFPERHQNILGRPIRDLTTNQLMTLSGTSRETDVCKTQFGSRWPAFRDDVGVFVDRLAPQSWSGVLADHGYNPSPAWSMIGSSVSSRISFATEMDWLTYIDVALVLVVVGMLAWSFGWESSVAFALILALGWPWQFGYIGGAFGRFLWIFLLASGLVCLHHQRFFWGGILIGISSALVVFPALLMAGPLFAWLLRPRDRQESSKQIIGFVVGGASAVLVSTLTYRWSLWQEFVANLLVHRQANESNSLGLRALGLVGLPHTVVCLLLVGGLVMWFRHNIRRNLPLWVLTTQGVLVPCLLLDLSSYYGVILALLGVLWVGRWSPIALMTITLITIEQVVRSGWLSSDQQYCFATIILFVAWRCAEITRNPEPPLTPLSS